MALREDLKTQGDFLFRHRSYLPLAVLAIGLSVKAYQEVHNQLAVEGLVSETLEAIALTVGLMGLLVRAATVGFVPADTSGRNTGAGQVAAVLNTTGAYSVTRNPLYFGNYLMWVAVAMMTGNIWFVALFSLAFWIYYERIIYAEEHFLRHKFGESYLAWAERTPAFLPAPSKFVRPARQLNWRKVLRQEKNGLFALVSLVCLFSVVGDIAEGEFSIAEEMPLIAATILTGVTYFILKLLKAKTSILSASGKNS